MTTPPVGAEYNKQGALWAFNACSGLFEYMLDEAFLIDSGPHYVAGIADIKLPGDSEARPAVGAYVFFSKSGGLALKRGGQMLQRTGPMGSYILASFLTDELVRGGGQVMGTDKDFGVRAFSGTSWGGPGGIFGTYYHAPTLHFVVTASDQADHVTPWAEIRFEGTDVIGDEEARSRGSEIFDVYAVVVNNVFFRAALDQVETLDPEGRAPLLGNQRRLEVPEILRRVADQQGLLPRLDFQHVVGAFQGTPVEEVGHRVEGGLAVVGEVHEVLARGDDEGVEARAGQGRFGVLEPKGEVVAEEGG